MSSQLADFTLESRDVQGVAVVGFPPNIVLSGPTALKTAAALSRLVASQPRLLLDFANVASLTSPMIGALFALRREAHYAGGRLAICRVSPVLREIFEFVKLTQVVSIYDSEEDALRTF
jgi:anti-anti-sigma factor